MERGRGGKWEREGWGMPYFPPLASASNTTLVTGCAVAQHCYNGDFTFLWKMEILTHSKIETREQSETQFVKTD